GDTIITSGFSNVFPKGIPIGTITGFNTVPGRKSYIIKMKTLIDMTNIGPVYVVKNNFKQELDSLKVN
ncbi:MAG TPA: rod shape-determining protein MreC, partial [Flavobacteriales bacterium]|nr:rod shape-determining protein MreC [Flavobacteriales bacterium]